MWRSPLDDLALLHAHRLALRQPRADYTFYQLPPLGNPMPGDIMPIWHPGQPGGRDYGITLKHLAEFINEDATTLFFDVEDYGAVPDTESTSAIQAAVNAAYASGGGTVLIKGNYQVSGPVTLDDGGIGIVGLSPTSGLTSTNNAADILSVTHTPNNNGLIIEGLQLKYTTCGGTGTAINVKQGENVRIYNCFLTDCPVGIDLRDCLQCMIFDCTIETVKCDGTIGIIVGGDFYKQCNVALIDNTLVRSFPGNTSCIGIIIGESYDARISNSKFATLATACLVGPKPGITLTHPLKANFNTFTACDFEASGHCVHISPYGGDADSQVIGMWFNGCYMRRGSDTLAGGPYPRIEIDVNGLPNTAVDTIIFNDCIVFNGTGAGLLIKGGQSIQVIGGRYSSNAQNAPSHGGISVDGPAANVQVVGANLTGVFPYPEGHTNYPSQPFAFTCANGAASVYLDSCDLRNNVNPNAPNGNGMEVLVDKTCTDVQIKNCVGTGWASSNAAWGGDTPANTAQNKIFEQDLPTGIFYVGPTSYRYTQRGHIHTSGGTAYALIGWAVGGRARIVLGGTFAPGDSITYTANSVPVSLNVVTADKPTIASQLATVINGNATLSTLLTATACTDNYGNACVLIVATEYSWGAIALGTGAFSQSISTTSVNGTVSLNDASHIIANIAAFTFPASQNSSFVFDMQQIANPTSNGEPAIWSMLWPGGGTIPLTGADPAGASVDRTVDQFIRCYAQFTNGASGSDYSEQNMYEYRRI